LFEKQGLMSHRGHRGRRERIALLFQSRSLFWKIVYFTPQIKSYRNNGALPTWLIMCRKNLTMAENKTVPTSASVVEFLNTVQNETQRNDSFALVEMMKAISSEQAVMWGEHIIGFGTYHYQYESGREGDFFRIGFAPRKSGLVLYLSSGHKELSDVLARMGKHKLSGSCIHVKRLSDVDTGVLRELVQSSWEVMNKRYPL
jgi:hypothetical protein